MPIKYWLQSSTRSWLTSIPRRGFLRKLAAMLFGSSTLSVLSVPQLVTAATNVADLNALQSQISGQLLPRNDEQYEIWRLSMMWQALKHHRYPDFIVQAANQDDVIAAVKFARQHNIKIAVRCGGHSWCHSAMRNGGMLLDISSLRAVTIDPEGRTAAAQPAINGRELTELLEPHGLAFPVPHCGMVPLSGYLLGGGLGWNGESWEGMACFSVRAIEIVTPEGELITANDQDHTDWFWAARGAGPGFFGVVTKYHLQLYPASRAITTSTYLWPLKHMKEVVAWWTEVSETLATEVEIIFLLASAPEAIFEQCQGDSHGKVCIISATAFADTAAEAKALLSPLAEGPLAERCVLRDEYQPSPYKVLFDWDEAAFPRERVVADTLWSNDKPVEVLSAVFEHFKSVPSPKTTVICQLRPKPRDYPDAAYSLRAPTYIASYANWKDAVEDEINTEWLRKAMRLMEPFAIGHYVNESDLAADTNRSIRSYSPANWQRLQSLRKQYDPTNLFHTYIGLT